jgi:hypothetical protein
MAPFSGAMKSQLLNLTYEIELQPGEGFAFPDDWKLSLGAGHDLFGCCG